MSVVLLSNISEDSGEFFQKDEQSFWDYLVFGLRIGGIILSFLGLVLNYFCFETTFQLKESNNVALMRYLSVWDSILLVEAGLVIMGGKLLDVGNFTSVNVSYDIFHMI